jgi:hypothetical protein
MKSPLHSALFILICVTAIWLSTEIAENLKPRPDPAPKQESPADVKVRMFLEGQVNMVDEADLNSARPELREAVYRLIE